MKVDYEDHYEIAKVRITFEFQWMALRKGGFQSSLAAHEKKKVTIRALKMGYQMTNLPDHSKYYPYPLLWVDLDFAAGLGF